MIRIVIIAVISLGVGTYSSCPFTGNEFNKAYVRLKMLNDARNKLIEDGFTIQPGEPAQGFFATRSIVSEIIGLTNNSNIALMAESIYRNRCPNPQRIFDPIDLRQMTNGENVCPSNNILCIADSKYRNIDGTCNNLNKPRMGATNTPYGRLAPAAYDDNVYAMRKSVSNTPLLSPRIIANKALTKSTCSSYPIQMANIASLVYGEVITHDVGRRLQHQTGLSDEMNGFSCCSKDYTHILPESLHILGCAAMEVSKDDPVLGSRKIGCLNYIRSQTVLANDCKMKGAQQINLATHLLDLSEIYGSSEEVQRSTRSFIGGKLLLVKDLLQHKADCANSVRGCYFSVHLRSDTTPTLASQEIMFHRLHNKVADKLSFVNSHWNDEDIYNEARRITIALHQHIVYDQWLPIYLGKDNTARRQLSCSNKSFCGRYNPNIDHSTTNDFSHGAFRSFHENLPWNLNGYDKDNNIVKHWTFDQLENNVKFLEQYMTIYLRGLMNDPITLDKIHEFYRNKLLNVNGASFMGIDLLAHDIQKGRDHGLQPYTYYLKKCYPALEVKTDKDLLAVFSAKNVKMLKEIYNHVDDIDLFVGLVLEEKFAKYTGLVTACILEEQFYRFKYGDRYFFSFSNSPNPFTQSQLDEIYKFSFGKMMCETTDIGSVLENAFLTSSITNPLRKCGEGSLASLDLSAWATI